MKTLIFYGYTILVILFAGSPIQKKADKNNLEITNRSSVSNIQAIVKWPIKVSDNHRYLVDNNGSPFLLFADTGWDLMCATSIEDGKYYIDDREEKNFTAIFTCLARPSNKSTIGMEPFYADNLLAPNKDYFNRCREYISYAQKKGMTMILIPFWASAFREKSRLMAETQLRDLGKYFGKTFKDFPNIIWAVGGDFTPENNTDIENMNWFAEGLNEEDSVHIITYFPGGARGSWQFFNNSEWLDFQLFEIKAIDSNKHYNKTKEGYQMQPIRPVFYGEACYEYYQTGQKWPYCTDLHIRRTLYWSITYGACGYTYGRRGVWAFDAADTYGYPQDGNWKDLLNSKGAKNIKRVVKFYSDIEWEKLVPDYKEEFVVSGVGSDTQKITASLANDGTFGLAYFPLSTTTTFDLTRITFGNKVKAQWFDPTSGEYFTVKGSPFIKINQEFTTPGENSDGDPDWILILNSDEN